MANLRPEPQPEDQGTHAKPIGPNLWDGLSFDMLFRSHDQIALEYLERRCKQLGGRMLETAELDRIVRNMARDLPKQSEYQLHEPVNQLTDIQRYGNCVLYKLARGLLQENMVFNQERLLDFALIGGFQKSSSLPRVHLGVRFKNITDEFVTPFDLDQLFGSHGFQGFELEIDLEKPEEPYQRAFYWMSREAFVDQMAALMHGTGLLYGFALREYKSSLEKSGQYVGYLAAPEIRRVAEETNNQTQDLTIQILVGSAPDQLILTLTHNALHWSIGYTARQLMS